jgi:hypothetical protein
MARPFTHWPEVTLENLPALRTTLFNWAIANQDEAEFERVYRVQFHMAEVMHKESIRLINQGEKGSAIPFHACLHFYIPLLRREESLNTEDDYRDAARRFTPYRALPKSSDPAVHRLQNVRTHGFLQQALKNATANTSTPHASDHV